ncbi:hypothetical protein BJX76DRAFT_354259 [Aspergillus varians]
MAIAIVMFTTCLDAFTALDLFFHTKTSHSKHLQWLQIQKIIYTSSLKHRLNWALQMPINYRRIGIKWQISQIPSRSAFLVHRLLTSILGFGASPLTSDAAAQFSQGHQNTILNEYDLSLATLPS